MRPAGSLRQAVLLNAALAGSLAAALKLNAPQPRPLASGEDATANRRCWSSYNSCQWVNDMVRFRGHDMLPAAIVDVSELLVGECDNSSLTHLRKHKNLILFVRWRHKG